MCNVSVRLMFAPACRDTNNPQSTLDEILTVKWLPNKSKFYLARIPGLYDKNGNPVHYYTVFEGAHRTMVTDLIRVHCKFCIAKVCLWSLDNEEMARPVRSPTPEHVEFFTRIQ